MQENILTKSKHIPQYLTGVAKIILFIIIVILFTNRSHNTSALSYQSTTDLQFTFNPVVSINISGGDLSIANLTPGSYADSNIITITASSNNADGYTLYGTVGSSTNNSTELRKDGTDTTNKFSSITSNISTLSGFSDSSNTWGYSYSTDSGSTWVSGNQGSTSTGYNGLPLYNSTNAATGVILADTPSASSSTIQFKIGARATTTQASGSYSNVVNFIGVPKVITRNYTIAYDANSGTGAPSSTSGTVTSTDPIVTLSTTTPTREGYTFKGWCDVSTSDDTCSGTTTQPGHIYAVNTTNTSAITVTMYAMWKPPIYMQDLDSTSIAALLPTIGSMATVYDKRDDKPYTIGRLKMDSAGTTSAYWMLENLALDLTTVTLDKLKGTADAPNTNASDQTLTYLKNGGGSGQYTGTAVAYAGSSNTFNTPLIAVSGTCYNAYCVNKPSSGNWSSDAATDATINGKTSIAQGKIGVYYNYCAASAGSYCYAGGAGSGNASEDICPAGWRLPTGGSGGEFAALYTAYSSNVNDFQTALSTPLSGAFNSGTARAQGNSGNFWSSTFYDTNLMHYLYVGSSDVKPFYRINRYNGYSVRCLLSS